MPPRKRKPAPKRRSGAAKALRSPHLRQRIRPGKRHILLDAFSPSVLRRLFEVERF
jgi:hypothetical protein